MNATFDLCCELIRRASVTPDDAGCQALMMQRLAAIGFECTDLPFGEVSNFWSERGTNGPILVLAGHTDVVPVEGQPWTTDPWTVVEKDGKLFGRGTCDMKGFDALAIWALVEAARRPLARPLQLAMSYDEEVGCTGCVAMVAEMAERLPRAAAVPETAVPWASRYGRLAGQPGASSSVTIIPPPPVVMILLPLKL